MGTKLAPALATIYIGDLGEAFLDSRTLKLDLWVRYINDVFMIWSHSRTAFDEFLEDLNKRQERIKFMAEVATQSCNFLDLTIYKSLTFLKTGLLSTKIYYKPTNTFSFPLGTSYMPKTIHRSIAIGEMTRSYLEILLPHSCISIIRINLLNALHGGNTPKNFLENCGVLYTHNLRLQIMYRIKRQKDIDRPLPLVTQYMEYRPTLNKILYKRWRNIYEEQQFYTLLPNMPFTAFKTRKILKSLLSAKRRKFETTEDYNTLRVGTGQEFKFTTFNNPKANS